MQISAALGLKVVLPTGDIVQTGGGPGTNVHQKGLSCVKLGGPDITGLFIGDGGVFGIKTEAAIYRCARCGICRGKYTEDVRLVCPVREVTGGFEHHFARGRILVARGILEGVLEYSPSLVESVYTCLGCGNCTEQRGAVDPATGKPLLDTPGIVRAMRVDIVRAGLGPLPVLKEIDGNVSRTHNPFSEALKRGVRGLPTLGFQGRGKPSTSPDATPRTGTLKRRRLQREFLRKAEWTSHTWVRMNGAAGFRSSGMETPT